MPGVRLNFNKDSIGMSFGVPGARYTVNSKGRRTASVGIPGTGLSDVTVLSSGRTKRSAGSAQGGWVSEVPVVAARPGLIASKAEKTFYAFMKEIFGPTATIRDSVGVVNRAAQLAQEFPQLSAPLDLLSVLHGVRDEATSEAAYKKAEELWANRQVIFGDKLVRKYFGGICPSVQITRGIFSSGQFNQQSFGFLVSEALQAQDRFADALAVLDQMQPDQLVGISIADLEVVSGDYDGAIETTEDIENEDDATAIMLVLRGIAFREKGLDDAALECFKRAIAKKSRSEDVIHRALFERAATYKKMGKNAAAKKDLEKILVDNPKAEGVTEALAAL